MDKPEHQLDDHEHFMDKVRLVILGEASTLSTFFLKNNQRLTKSNYAQLSRLSSLILEDEDEAGLNEDYLVVDPLIKNLILLKSRLSKEKIVSFDPLHIKPFCDVIVNKDVSGPITGLALHSILKFLNYGFIKDGEMVRLISESVTKARFVGTDSSSDEVVLMRILSVLENLIVQPFYSLTNGLVCEIMQSCFRIAFETRLSELLRKCAIQCLSEMVRALFSRIPHFDQDISDYNYFYQDKSNASFHKLNRMGRRFVHHHNKHTNKQIKINKEDLSDSDCNRRSYGLACIHELLSYLTSLINPLPDGQNTDSMIQVGLDLLTIIFETSVQDIGSKYCLLSVVKTDLCWNVMQLLLNERNLNKFACALRLAFLIFVNLRMHLKFQFEAYLLRLMDLVTTMNAPLEFRDISVENLLLLFRQTPYLPHELFYNFDCDPYSSNILEDLLSLFSKNCFTNSNSQNANTHNVLNFTTLQMLSFEVLLSNLKSLHNVELRKNNYFTANPATMIVNISNNKDVFVERSLKDENIYNVLNSVKDLEEQSQAANVIDVQGDSLVSDEVVLPAAPTAAAADEVPASAAVASNSTPPNNELENFELLHNSNGSLHEITASPESTESNSTTVNKYCVTYLFPDVSRFIETSEQIVEMKQRKALLWTATERFNQKPAKGIEFLHENHLVSNEDEIVAFLKNNPKLDKKQIGEYLSNKKNTAILSKFVENFAFKDIRIDEALRLYLESFRLPGEAPLISLVLEQFAHHWHESNGCPFVNEDAAFSLAYAIIMLNVDQHNSNVKRQTNPMTCDEFISNLRQVNGGKDFDRTMLSEIYYVIKSNEIIMPAEQTGVVKEKYLWKCLLKNSETLNGVYWFCDARPQQMPEKPFESFKDEKENAIFLHLFNKPIFNISWGPSISTMTLVFDKLNPDKQPTLSRRVLNNGFTNYALLCANYGHLDDLIVNLSKFVITSGSKITSKSELVAHCLFGITKEYANEMRTSWTNIIELILFWYDNKLLDDGFEIEDFALENKTIKFVRKHSVKAVRQIHENANQSTFLSSFYSYFANMQMEDGDINEQNDADKLKSSPAMGGENIESSIHIVNRNEYCRALMLIIEESKFLHIDSLIELIRALISVQFSEEFDDDIEVLKLETLVKVILMNRDRLSIFWEHINKHIVRLMKYCPQSQYLTERIISTVFRLAIRFTPRPDPLNEQIFLLIYQILLTFDPVMLQRHVTAQALYTFVLHCNSFFTKNEEWALIFNLILAVAIGYYPSNKKLATETNNVDTRGYTSDSELSVANSNPTDKVKIPLSSSSKELNRLSHNLNIKKNFNENVFAVNNSYRILDAEAYEKCADIMSLIITEYLPKINKGLSQPLAALPHSINSYEISQMAVGALCKFVEASIKIQMNPTRNARDEILMKRSVKERSAGNQSRFTRLTNAILSSSESDSEDDMPSANVAERHVMPQPKLSSVTESCSLKLLNLMQFFHINAITIVGESVNSDVLWNSVWCPLLQAISFFCCDCRRPVRMHAFTFLQRTLLLHDLNALNAVQWESCFNKVLFPLLSKLLEPINMCDPIGMDETRMRTTNLLCKVFLQHLHPLLTLNTFTALWLTILDFMDKYIKADMQTDLVKEAIPESLKNILLVMKTAGYFNDTLAAITWDRINVFLPTLYQELLPSHGHGHSENHDSQPPPSETAHSEVVASTMPAMLPRNDIQTPDMITAVDNVQQQLPALDQTSHIAPQPVENCAEYRPSRTDQFISKSASLQETNFYPPNNVSPKRYGVDETTRHNLSHEFSTYPNANNDGTPTTTATIRTSPTTNEIPVMGSKQETGIGSANTIVTEVAQVLPPAQIIYNIPSTFIDMESVCVYHAHQSPTLPHQQQSQATTTTAGNTEIMTTSTSSMAAAIEATTSETYSATKTAPPLPFAQFSGNSYPGTIAQFHPDGNVSAANYFHYATPDRSLPVATSQQSQLTQSAYPWPSPNLTEASSFNK